MNFLTFVPFCDYSFIDQLDSLGGGGGFLAGT